MTLRPLPLPPPPERGSPRERSRRRPVFHRCASFSSSSWPPALPSSPLILFRSRRDGAPPLHSVIVTHGEREVDRTQPGENAGLHHADERSHAIERARDANLRAP